LPKKRDVDAILMSMNDNVATALTDLELGSRARVARWKRIVETEIKSPIPFGHKYALDTIKQGEPIVKYGEIIGVSTKNIEAGEHVHVHNIVSLRGRGDKV